VLTVTVTVSAEIFIVKSETKKDLCFHCFYSYPSRSKILHGDKHKASATRY
jgi:hypothetical protein